MRLIGSPTFQLRALLQLLGTVLHLQITQMELVDLLPQHLQPVLNVVAVHYHITRSSWPPIARKEPAEGKHVPVHQHVAGQH